MSHVSRRTFVGSLLATSALATNLPIAKSAPKRASSSGRELLRVQYTTGGHTVPLTSFTIFTDDTFADIDTTVFPHPNSFCNLNGESGKPGPNVLVLYDYVTESYTDEDQRSIRKYLDSGKGLVVIHHALCDNQFLPWWRQEVTGGALIQRGIEGIRRGRLKQFPIQEIRPVGNHPIVKGIEPFLLPRDEAFVDMWMSPNITPLLQSNDPDLGNKTIAWIGVHPKARVVCSQPGHTTQVCADPRYRHLVHNMILWSAGRLS
jgi:type 1 glutamine amidotransferase